MAKNSVDILVKARDEASKQFGAIGRSVAGMGKMIAAAGAAAAVYFSAKALKDAFKDTLDSYAKQEAAVIKLGKALDLLGKKNQIKNMSDFATEMQKITVYGDEVILELMALGASMGKLSGSDLQDATKAAIGLSEAFNIELSAAMTLISKAAQGNTSALSRYGIKVDDTLTSQEKFNSVLKQGIAMFPMAQAAAQTFSGSITQMKNAIDDAKEEIGAAFAPAVTAVAAKIKEFSEGARENIIQFVETSKIYLKVFTENWKLIFELAAKEATLHIIGFALDIKHWFTVALPQYLSWFRDNWKNVFMDIFNGTKAVINNLWTNFKNFFTAVWDWLKGGDFEFAWTPLLDGFKKTAEDLPEIAERSLSEIEKSLKSRTEQIKNDLAQKVQLEITAIEQKKAEDKAKQLVENGKYKGSGSPWSFLNTTSDTLKTSGLTSALESRFLTAAPKNNYYSNMVKHNQEVAKNTRQLNLMPKVVEGINNMTKLLGGDDSTSLPAGL